jgi:cytochrome P450
MLQPKPPHSFLWGHLKIFGEIVKSYPPNSHPQLYYTALVQRYNLPDIFYVDLWPVGPSQMFVVHRDAASHVENGRWYSVHSVVEHHLRPMLGRDVIAAANGSTWKMLHRMIAPAFAPSSVKKSMISIVAEETMRFHASLDCLAETGEAFSMEDTVAKLIFDVLGKLVFGFPMNAQITGSEILTDIHDTIKYATQARNAWNPLVTIWAYLKKRQRMKRVDRYIRSKIAERYDVLKGEENLPNRKNASSVLDRFLIEKLEEKADETPEKYRSGLDAEFLEIAANK